MKNYKNDIEDEGILQLIENIINKLYKEMPEYFGDFSSCENINDMLESKE